MPKTPNEGMGIRKMEGGFKLRLFFSGTDLVGRGAPADQQGDGINEERLAGAGLPRQDRKAGLKLEIQLLNKREIDDAQLEEHCGG